jgi:hypothetical protein
VQVSLTRSKKPRQKGDPKWDREKEVVATANLKMLTALTVHQQKREPNHG